MRFVKSQRGFWRGKAKQRGSRQLSTRHKPLICFQSPGANSLKKAQHSSWQTLRSLWHSIRGKPLSWIASYSANSTQSIVIDGVASEPVEVKYVVPQGSILGPKLYSIYVSCLRRVADEYGINIKQYSDDTAIYLEFGFSLDCLDQFDALRILSKCAGDLIDWFSYNWIKLNPPKSEVLYFAPSELANKLIMLPLRVGVHQPVRESWVFSLALIWQWIDRFRPLRGPPTSISIGWAR